MRRFLEEILDYIGLTAEEQTLLRELHPRLAPHFAAIAAQFDEPERMSAWMSRGLLGPYDEAFAEKQFARATMFRAITLVRTTYIEKLVELYPADEVGRAVRAVNKLLDIELAVMMRHHQLESEDKLVRRERRIQGDKLAAMQTLSSGLAHEVRNPLNAAALQLELLERRLRRGPADPKLVEPIELANHELARLTAMLNDFLQFARPPELHVADQDVLEIVRHVIELERPLADRRHVALDLAEREPVFARVDSGKLHQILQNLVRNGLEAALDGGRVEVELQDGAASLFHIRVRDDGPGIPDEVLPRIFEPFFSTKDAGTGMGMAIVHSLVALHGGKIEIDTSPEGTQFDIELPR